MAKLSLINRDKKRREIVKKFAAKRAELTAAIEQCEAQRRRALCSPPEVAAVATRFQSGALA